MSQKQMQFSDPVILELSFKANTEFVSDKPLNVEMTNGFSVKIEKATGYSSALVLLTASINQKNSSNSPFILNCTMASEFEWDEDFLDKDIDETLLTQAPSILMGYMRSVIADVTAKSPFPPYNIPYVDFSNSKPQ